MVLQEKEEYRGKNCQRADLQQFRAEAITDFILNVSYHLIMATWNSEWRTLKPNLNSTAQDHDLEKDSSVSTGWEMGETMSEVYHSGRKELSETFTPWICTKAYIYHHTGVHWSALNI